MAQRRSVDQAPEYGLAMGIARALNSLRRKNTAHAELIAAAIGAIDVDDKTEAMLAVGFTAVVVDIDAAAKARRVSQLNIQIGAADLIARCQRRRNGPDTGGVAE